MNPESEKDPSSGMSEAELKGAMALEEMLSGMTQKQRDMILQYLLDNAGKYPIRRNKPK